MLVTIVGTNEASDSELPQPTAKLHWSVSNPRAREWVCDIYVRLSYTKCIWVYERHCGPRISSSRKKRDFFDLAVLLAGAAVAFAAGAVCTAGHAAPFTQTPAEPPGTSSYVHHCAVHTAPPYTACMPPVYVAVADQAATPAQPVPAEVVVFELVEVLLGFVVVGGGVVVGFEDVVVVFVEVDVGVVLVLVDEGGGGLAPPVSAFLIVA
jgi:hypothetical protein